METGHLVSPTPLGDLPQAQGAYLVGGTVRDLLLDRPPVDCDVAVAGDPVAYAKALLRLRPGRLVFMGRPGQAVVRVVTPGRVFDVCGLNGARIEEDLLQRDFSINAMAVSLSSGRLIDPAGGAADLAAGTVRMVSRPVFTHDPARLLRAYRVAAQLGFHIAAATAAAIAQDAPHLVRAAPERLREEWFKLLACPGAAAYLAAMAQTGLLTRLFPEMEALKGCRQPPPHRLDVFDHSLETVSRLEGLLQRPPDGLERHRRALDPLHRPACAARLKCAALLHDIGKPACRSVDAAGRIHFYGHARLGAQMVAQAGRRLRFSRAESTYIDTVVQHHTRLLSLFDAWRRDRLSGRAVARCFKACGELSADVVVHAMADMQAKSADREPGASFGRFGLELIEHFFGRFEAIRSGPPLITGHDLIRLGLTPSPLFGRLLDQVDTARLAGSVTTREEAEALVRKLLGQD